MEYFFLQIELFHRDWSCYLFEDFLLCLAESYSGGGLEKPVELWISQKNVVISGAVTYKKNIEILEYVSEE